MFSQKVIITLTAVTAGLIALLWTRQPFNGQSSDLIIDVGYAKYQGFYNQQLNANVWLGLRFADPPTRFQRAQSPTKQTNKVVQASHRGNVCAQMSTSGGITASELVLGDEDCLFLNVYVPKNASNAAPVVVWIHGGGYGYGTPNAFGEETGVMEIDDGKTILVSITYRTNIFGFLSSNEIKAQGSVNLGIHDQLLALDWVHDHIGSFGGDPDHVTIWGESAGGGSVMLLSYAYGGELNTSLWRGAIANSPYLPPHYEYNDAVPQSYYDGLVKATDCADKPDTFACLSAVPYKELFTAGAKLIADISPYGTWGPAPVTDHDLLRSIPATGLASGKVNGEYIFTGNLGSEGTVFIDPKINTEEDFKAWFEQQYPSLNEKAYQRVSELFPEPSGDHGPYATQVERASALYGAWTFDCASYWLASSFAPGKAWKYVDNVAPPIHGRDLQTFFQGTFFPDFGTDMISQREVIVGNLVSFWQHFTPAKNRALENLAYLPFEASNKYPEMSYGLTDAGKTEALVGELNISMPKACELLKDILLGN